MDKWFELPSKSLLAIALSALGIYIAVIAFTRLGGKRSFSKMSSFDFAITISIGSMLASTILSRSVSLFQGMFGILTVYAMQHFLAHMRKYRFVQKLIDNPPLLLMEGEEILYDNLKKAKVTEADLRGKLREANVIKLNQVRAVVFESTGDISVLHADPESKLENWLIGDVHRK